MSRQTGSLIHRLRLRKDFDIEVLLPYDFSKSEVERVTRWIEALALPDEIAVPAHAEPMELEKPAP